MFTKFGAGVFDLKNVGVTPFSPGVVNVAGGGLTLSGTTQLPNPGTPTLFSGVLRLDNTGTAVSNRLGVQSSVRFGSGGVGTFQIDAGATPVAQTLASLVIGPSGTGSGRVPLTSGGGSVLLTLTGAAGYGVTGNNSPSFVLAGDGLAAGTLPTGPGTTGVIFSPAPTEANAQWSAADGAGAAGTVGVGVYRGGYGIVTSSGVPTAIGLLTQTNPAVGARLLDVGTEYATGFTANSNVRLTAGASTGAATVNSLSLVGSAATIASGSTLTVRGGTILATGGASSITGSGPSGGGAVLASAGIGTAVVNSGFVTYVEGGSTLTLNATLSGSAAGARLVKVGPGTLVFDPRDAAGAAVNFGATVTDTRIFDGTLAVPAGQSLANLPGNLFLTGGAGSVFQNRGASVATAKTLSLTGDGGTLDLAGTVVQLNATAAALFGPPPLVTTSGFGGVLRLASGTLVLGNGTSGTPAALQPNTLEGGVTLSGGTLALNADSTLASANTVLGTGTLRLSGGQLAPLYATRAVAVPVEVPLGQNPTFSNNLTGVAWVGALTADTSNSGLTFLAPMRLMGSSTFTSNLLGGGAVTFSGSFYDNPYSGPATLTLSGTPAGPFVLNAPSAHRGGTVVAANTLVSVTNGVGSATGSGPVTVQAGGTLSAAAAARRPGSSPRPPAAR